jgi:hypothetical protein
VPCSRRGLLQASGLGFGWAAFGGLAQAWAAPTAAAQSAALGAAIPPHFAPRAKHVIFLFMDGGVSHVDTFDPKPELDKRSGQPAEWQADEKSQAAGQGRKWLGSLWPFSKRGQSGLWVSDLFPHQAAIADRLCVVRSLTGESPLHGAQNLLLHTGRSVGAAPSMGAWISYGLGTDNENLPGYVLLNNDWVPNGGFQNFASGFLPATCQATTVRSKGTPVDNILAADPPEVQRAKLDFLRSQSLAAAGPAETAAVEAAIRTYETAARMQTTIPDVCDVASETEATRRLYGRDHHVSGYTIWLAGGGFKGGNVYGTTDEMGMGVVENPLDIHDIHATVLRQLGIDHKRLTFRFGGRDMRLTDVKGRVIADLLA